MSRARPLAREDDLNSVSPSGATEGDGLPKESGGRFGYENGAQKWSCAVQHASFDRGAAASCSPKTIAVASLLALAASKGYERADAGGGVGGLERGHRAQQFRL